MVGSGVRQNVLFRAGWKHIFCIAGFENVLVAGVPATCGER